MGTFKFLIQVLIVIDKLACFKDGRQRLQSKVQAQYIIIVGALIPKLFKWRLLGTKGTLRHLPYLKANTYLNLAMQPDKELAWIRMVFMFGGMEF